jgi:SAM-dependent methyltransferase
MNQIALLKSLYLQESKHSSYQILPKRLQAWMPIECVAATSRYELERLQFIEHVLSFDGKRVLDIGANAGFFTFEALDRRAKAVVGYEGNLALAEFMRVASELLQVQEQVCVYSSYFDATCCDSVGTFDVTFLMNVLHHLGDDFGDSSITIESARHQIADSVRRMAGISKILVFQMGYCWKGDRNYQLFDQGTKQEQIDFVDEASDGCWKVLATGIPEVVNGRLAYLPATKGNLIRQDALGEFLNRPLFVLESLLI